VELHAVFIRDMRVRMGRSWDKNGKYQLPQRALGICVVILILRLRLKKTLIKHES